MANDKHVAKVKQAKFNELRSAAGGLSVSGGASGSTRT
jgi:hypothetical protein